MIPIHTMGDSHAGCGWSKIPGVLTHIVGAVLMNSLGIKKPIITKNIPDDVIICFCFGEIDCRCHIHKYPPYDKTIDYIVRRYIEFIDLNMVGKKEAWIYNVVPPSRSSYVQRKSQFPFVGTDEERLTYTKYMNEKLRGSKYTFVDVYDKYADSEGFLNQELAMHGIHIKDNRYLLEWVENKRTEATL